MTITKGFDISANNGEHIDFHAAFRAGYRFCFIKVSEGTYTNPFAKKHAHDARAAGFFVGAYDFVSPKVGRTGAQEADLFVRKAREVDLLRKGSIRPAADVEVTKLPSGKASRRYHYSFIERLIETHKIIKPFVYTASWFWEGVLGAKNSHGCPLWLASYTSKWRNLIPRAWKRVVIHQYTDQGVVPGIQGKVDLNDFFGSVDDLRRHYTLKVDH